MVRYSQKTMEFILYLLIFLSHQLQVLLCCEKYICESQSLALSSEFTQFAETESLPLLDICNILLSTQLPTAKLYSISRTMETPTFAMAYA